MKTKIFFRNIHLLAEKYILKIFGKIQSVQFPAVNNISKFHENKRQKKFCWRWWVFKKILDRFLCHTEEQIYRLSMKWLGGEIF